MRPRLVAILLVAAAPLAAASVPATWQGQLESPNGELRVNVDLDDAGSLGYQLFRAGGPVVQRSPLGVSLHNTRFAEGLSVVAEMPMPVSDTYRMRVGKRREIEYRANELAIQLRNEAGHGLVVRLRLSNDGFAYRYEFLGESEDPRIVTSEESGTHFFSGTKAWLQPKAEAQSGWSRTNPSYEEDYHQEIDVGTPSPTAAGWVYPALFRYGETWIVLSETGMDGRYCGSGLAQESPDGLYRVQFPQPGEVTTNGKRLPEARLPFHSPWRLVLAGSLQAIAESTLGTDLAEPSVLSAIDFAQPGISAWSWGVLKDDATIFPVQKAFVDYASEMSWPYVLVDADWDQKIGYGKLAELAQYAAGRGVGLLAWYNSSGDWNQTVYSPKSRLLTRADRRAEFARLQAMGIRGVKVDFFPGDGLSVIQYYRDILMDAAEFDLMVNFHGATLPRGLERTFPNLMTMEGVKGFEFVTFTQEFADQEATHAATLPFTRNLFDPMDFTPMVLGDIPNIERRTRNGFELALPVLFTSGIQHLVTTPEQMETVPEFVRDYLRRLPAEWDESRFLAGYPGRYVVFARRAGERWYVAGINAGAEPRTFDLDLSFVPPGTGRLITDGERPRELTVADVGASSGQGGRQQVTVAPSGGFVMVFSPERAERATFTNPLNDSGPDPWVTWYEGNYYLAATTWGDPSVGLTMRKAATIAELKAAEPVQIFQDSTPDRCCNFWAPEFFLLDGPNGRRWYGYFTGGAAGEDYVRTQFMHVIESDGLDPMGPYHYMGKLVERNALDGSVLELNGTRYAIYSVWNETQDLAIRQMSSPWETVGEETTLSKPTYPWEVQTHTVNEGPVAIHRDGRTFVVYSASACWGADYKLGLLEFNGGDPLDAGSWTKYPDPVFERVDDRGVFAPGHNTFFKSPDGTEDWMAYHANDQESDVCDMGRTPRIQRITWNEDGTPNLGLPASESMELAVPSRTGEETTP